MPGKKKKSGQGVDPTVLAAIITVIGTLLVTLVTYKPIEAWWSSRLNPTPMISIGATFTPITSETPTKILIDTPTQFFTETPTPLLTDVSPTQLINLGKMNAQLVYNYATVNAPLSVTFNAHSSYLSYQDGTIETCEFSNVCSYSWDVRQGSTPIYGPESGGSVFSYTFTKKGDYTVVVYVCRGEICNFAAASITAK